MVHNMQILRSESPAVYHQPSNSNLLEGYDLFILRLILVRVFEKGMIFLQITDVHVCWSINATKISFRTGNSHVLNSNLLLCGIFWLLSPMCLMSQLMILASANHFLVCWCHYCASTHAECKDYFQHSLRVTHCLMQSLYVLLPTIVTIIH